ncbi:hypothetical protein HMPREF3221_00405 [Fusobacterium nucleatum]|uniref:Uncharacterized protein n=1 Tax=Fusobacterium nucleatum TaxID=851 RepID=A0A133P8L4_FUSNU|nr:hypothetical protein HMPREF3221_00405 [Fusobacterium nucleatum]
MLGSLALIFHLKFRMQFHLFFIYIINLLVLFKIKIIGRVSEEK